MQYRQVSHKLLIQRGAGNPDLVSQRPRRGRRGSWGEYIDSDAKPTLVEFDDRCIVDVEYLLKIGAIIEYTPPVTKPRKGGNK